MSNPCPICGSQNYSLLFRKFQYIQEYEVVRCNSCNFVTIAPYPTPAQIAQYYQDSYNPSYMGSGRTRLQGLAKKRLQLLLPFKSKGALVELGCGSGAFLAEASSHFTVTGVEVSPASRGFADSLIQNRIIPGDLFSFATQEKFDVVVLAHVIEHLHDVNDACARLRALCAPDGILLLLGPNVRSFAAQFWGKYWEWYSPPRHLSYFDLNTIRRLLEKHGFEVISLTTQRGDDYNFLMSLIMVILSRLGILRNIYKKHNSAAVKQSDKVMLLIYEIIFRVTNALASPFQGIAKILAKRGLGSELVIIARPHPLKDLPIP